MRFLADECCDAGMVAALRAVGHDVRYVAETDRGADDQTVMALAAKENRIVLTEDKDFGELAVRRQWPTAGLIMIRMDPVQRERKALRVRALIERFGDRLAGHYAVVEDDRFRLRPLRVGQT